ncbi:MAG: hypothetical protein ACTSYI_11315 [Promethearchaeota archaeon]
MHITLNPNLKERRMGYFFLGVFFLISLFYLFYDGWLYEWVEFGYEGINQHWDLKVFGDLDYEIINGEYIYHSTHNLQHFFYLCYYSAAFCYFYLITGSEWLRQGAIATMAFPVMTFFSTINPIYVKEIFSPDAFRFHSYYLQFVFDLNHIGGMIMGFYIFYTSVRDKFKMDFKKMTPFIMFTWLIYMITKVVMTEWPFWAGDSGWGPTGAGAYYDTNQINMFPVHFYGLEFLIVVGLLYFINVGVKFSSAKIKDPKWQAIVPYAFFSGLTIIMVLIGAIQLQNIPWQAFPQT